MELSWFGVKTLFRVRAIGSPTAADKAFDQRVDLIEERIVLFRARSLDDAISRAEAEARRYAKSVWHNPYGQKVVTQYLGACDAFGLFDPPGPGVEVFSSMVLVSSTDSRRELAARWFGPPERSPDPRRRKFLNREYSGAVGAASNKPLQPTIRARQKAKPKPRSRAARG